MGLSNQCTFSSPGHCPQYRLVHDFIISMYPNCTFNIPASLAQTTPLQLPVQMLCGQPLLSSQGYDMTLVCLLQLLDQRVQVISTVSLGVCSFYIRVTLSVVCITYTCSAGMYLGCSLLTKYSILQLLYHTFAQLHFLSL